MCCFMLFHIDRPSVKMQAVNDVDTVREWVRDARRIVVLTGAGISTDSGIPDFRGPNGVWTKNPAAEKTATLQYYMGDPEVRKTSWRNRLESPAWSAEPNAGHRAVVELEKRGQLLAVVTQNIDELHQAAGTSPELVIEVHGSMRHVKCMSCGERAPMERALERVRAGEEDPPCRTCGGILKSATISFGENLVAADLMRAEQVALQCDLMLAVERRRSGRHHQRRADAVRRRGRCRPAGVDQRSVAGSCRLNRPSRSRSAAG